MKVITVRFCWAVTFLLLSVKPTFAGIGLFQDFDSGSLNVAASSIEGNQVHLVGRKTWTSSLYGSENQYAWVYFKASNLAGLQPQFDVPLNFSWIGDLTNHHYVYSYDQKNWNYFDNAEISGDKYRFSNDTPFTQDDVYVAYSFPYPTSRTEAHVASIAPSPYVLPTSSSNEALVIGQSAGGTDEMGRTFEPNPLYGFKITDPSATGPKKKIVLVGGNHSAETLGNIALEGMIDFLLGDAAEAVRLRKVAEFYVYPQVNPDGREAGYYRSNPENPDLDHNRVWNDPTGCTDVTIVRNAMQTDTNGNVDYLFDFHSYFGPWTRPDHSYAEPIDCRTDFTRALMAVEPNIRLFASNGSPGHLRVWAKTASGLNAKYAYSLEFGAPLGRTENQLTEMGRAYALALNQTISVPEPSTITLLLIAAFTANRFFWRKKHISCKTSDLPENR